MSEPTHPAIRKALVVHEVFRKLGVPASSIYVSAQDDLVLLVAKPMDGDGYAVPVGELDGLNAESLLVTYREAGAWWNDESPEAKAAQEKLFAAVYPRIQSSGGLVPALLYVQTHQWPKGEA